MKNEEHIKEYMKNSKNPKVCFRRINLKILKFVLILFSVSSHSFSQQTKTLDLSPAQWIWYPSGRVLQNTFVLFRKEFDLDKQPDQAKGWILADSRYLLYINGERVQWGPAPYDPRFPEADPVDIAPYLKAGKNVIACQVLYYGGGDGTWVIGNPGFLFKLDVDDQQIVSNNSWSAHLAKSWEQGQYKRWFLRCLQENFDARQYPYGWNSNEFELNDDWLPAAQSNVPANKPSICTNLGEYMWNVQGNPNDAEIRARSIPMMRENDVKVKSLVESAWVKWVRPAEEYFDVMPPNAYQAEWMNTVRQTGVNSWTVPENKGKAAVLTFEFAEQSVGWPYFTIEAPAGTIVELLVHEAHQPGGPVVINSHFNSWTRFVCREGVNRFETFDFESVKWLQLHVRNYSGEIKISDAGMRRRQYDFAMTPQIKLSDPVLQRLMNATVNNLYNSVQETVVDGMGRERQQYTGEAADQLLAVYQVFGDVQLPARYIKTFSQGMTKEGYFMCTWPAFDRLARFMQRQIELTPWGPNLYASSAFCTDNYRYYLYTGDTIALQESFPRLLRYFDYLTTIRDDDGLLRVENLGVPWVLIDFNYRKFRHNQCGFNLLTSAMLIHELAPICRVFGQTEKADEIERFGKDMLSGCIDKFWSREEQTFMINLPWLQEEGAPQYCERSLATAVLYGLCPDNNINQSIDMLVNPPAKMVKSGYPGTAVWRLWALAEAGKINIVLNDLRRKWATMPSVLLNNTIQEFFDTSPDSEAQWSHCASAPIIMLYHCIAGIKPLTSGYETFQIRPQPGDLKEIELYPQTAKGQMVFKCKGVKGDRELYLEIPEGTTAFLQLDPREKISLKPQKTDDSTGLATYRLNGNTNIKLKLKYL